MPEGGNATAVTEPDDEGLVRQAQAGSMRSFNLLVERYQGPLYNLCLRYVGDRQLAEDVVQEAFLSAWRAINSWKGGSFKAWLFRIAVNEARDLHRRNSRRPSSSLDDLLEQGTSFGAEADKAPGPEAVSLSAATLRSIESALQRLPEDQRLVVLLSDVQGLTYEEMCATLGLPLGTVKSRLFRARVALRKLLVESGELP
ncbi:MAG: sigma-70 family RNA polymerase sigma factor [Chloroflexota bacterium]|nr:sigma-70 family RNA polymerase sigma factor [Chloroflexota bacterium]